MNYLSSFREPLLGKTQDWILKYTSSMEEDRIIAKEVIEILIAHTKHLVNRKIIPHDIGFKVLSILNELLSDPSPLFKIKAEDIHEAIEIYLEQRIGKDANWIAIAKSRNDHIAAILRLKTKKLLLKLIESIIEFRKNILDKASHYLDVLMPAYTHLQPAQVVTYAHYLTHIENTLALYTKLLLFITKEVVDESPLGVTAIASTIVPIDRYELAQLAGFRDIVENSICAVSSRDFLTITSSIVTCLAIFLSRIAEDMIISVSYTHLTLPTN